MPKVYNKHHRDAPEDAVYIGRPSSWGNPFTHLKNTAAEYQVETREEAIKAYEKWATNSPEFVDAIKRNLKGKDLVCWCAPLACHGDVLLRIANAK